MSKPSVCAVMLVNGREAMARRAIRSFEAQTYQRKQLLVFDTGRPYCNLVADTVIEAHEFDQQTVGELRNCANELVDRAVQIIVHWDSDDYSHPNRISEQVALLEVSGKDVVGYRDMLFWDETKGQFCGGQFCGAWMYENDNSKFLLGTSFCYWRSVWERHPFPDLPKGPQSAGEDTVWLDGLRRLGISSGVPATLSPGRPLGFDQPSEDDCQPRMIASIHGGNTSGFWLQHRDKEPMFRRAPEWDSYCREKMAL